MIGRRGLFFAAVVVTTLLPPAFAVSASGDGPSRLSVTARVERDALSVAGYRDARLVASVARYGAVPSPSLSSFPLDVQLLDSSHRTLWSAQVGVEWRPCLVSISGHTCASPTIVLPLSAERHGCLLSVSVPGSQFSVPWGQCLKYPMVTPHMPDLAATSVSVADDGSATLTLSELGDQYGLGVRVLAVAYGNTNKPLGAAIRDVEGSIPGNGSVSLDLGVVALPATACKLTVSVDPDGYVREKSKANNVLTVPYGRCEDADFNSSMPDLAVTTGRSFSAPKQTPDDNAGWANVSFSIANIGFGVAPSQGTEIGFSVALLDRSLKPIYSLKWKKPLSLFPEKAIQAEARVPEPIYEATDTIVVQANPDKSFGERDYTNNIYFFKRSGN